jgi:hypothetical protein
VIAVALTGLAAVHDLLYPPPTVSRELERAQCLAGLEAVERTDHMYRDTLRAVCLNALGRVALDQGDEEAAVAAFRQCELHLGGRPRSLGAGWLLCQALAGAAAANGGDAVLRRALDLFEKRRPYDWSWLWLCSEEATIADLARAQRRSS